jgi:hypothetical protein
LLVKQYDPLPEDQDTYTWTDLRNGQPRALKMPRFAVADIGGAQETINRYVGDNMQSYIDKKIGRHDTIPWNTFQMAMKLSAEGASSYISSSNYCIHTYTDPCRSHLSFAILYVCGQQAESSITHGK